MEDNEKLLFSCMEVSNSMLKLQAELYRVERMFEKAEPLYLEAIEILDVTLGPGDLR